MLLTSRSKPAAVRAVSDIPKVIGRMTLAQKVGQCMTLGFYGTTITDKVLALIQTLNCGGLRLTPHVNTSGNADIVRRLAPYHTPGQYAGKLNELQHVAAARPLGLPLHMVTDQEGDLSVDILRGGMNFFPSQMGLAATGSPALMRQCAAAVARQLRAIGIHMVHSPVLDVNVNPRNPEIGCRSFSNDPDTVARYGLAFMRGLKDGGIIATGKHFPGRGDSDLDAHESLPVLRVDRARMDAVELYPYRHLIGRGLPAVMTAHNAYAALDDETTPASVSRRIVTGVLREQLGFDGVVTTDAMSMGGLTAVCSTPEGCARAIAAGNDLVLVKDCNELPFECFDAMLSAVKRGEIPEAQLDQSVRRILTMKLNYGIFDKRYVKAELADRTVRDAKIAKLAGQAAGRCLTVVRDERQLLPLSKAERIMVLLPIRLVYHEKSNDAGYAPEQLYLEVRRHAPQAQLVEFADPAADEVMEHAVTRAGDFDVVVVFNQIWRGPATSHEVVRRLTAAGRKVVVVSNNIYDGQFLPEARTLVVTYSAMPPSMKAAADLLFGKARARGVSPLVG